jgi:hypothetical protein
LRGTCTQSGEGSTEADAKYQKLIGGDKIISVGLGGPEMLLPIGAEGKAAEEGAAAAEAAAPVIKAVAGKITGYTQHGLEQAMSNDGVGVSVRAMLDAVRSPTGAINQAKGAVKYIGKDAVVVLNEAGKVITTWATSHAGWRQVP